MRLGWRFSRPPRPPDKSEARSTHRCGLHTLRPGRFSAYAIVTATGTPHPALGRATQLRAARARWKIENEGFNTLKNQGYHLEHNFGHGDQHLSEALFTLNLLAFFMHQIFELVDGLYQRVRTFFSSRRAFWDEVRSAFRLFLFTSWDQVLVRMNSPPQPLPPYQNR